MYPHRLLIVFLIFFVKQNVYKSRNRNIYIYNISFIERITKGQQLAFYLNSDQNFLKSDSVVFNSPEGSENCM